MMHILSGIKGIKKICLTKTQNVVTPGSTETLKLSKFSECFSTNRKKCGREKGGCVNQLICFAVIHLQCDQILRIFTKWATF